MKNDKKIAMVLLTTFALASLAGCTLGKKIGYNIDSGWAPISTSGSNSDPSQTTSSGNGGTSSTQSSVDSRKSIVFCQSVVFVYTDKDSKGVEVPNLIHANGAFSAPSADAREGDSVLTVKSSAHTNIGSLNESVRFFYQFDGEGFSDGVLTSDPIPDDELRIPNALKGWKVINNATKSKPSCTIQLGDFSHYVYIVEEYAIINGTARATSYSQKESVQKIS